MQDVLVDGFAPLRELGYSRRGMRWRRRGELCTLIVGLQKSRFRERYYPNIALVLHEIDELPNCPFHKAHIYGRWSDNAMQDALLLDREVSPQVRSEFIALNVRQRLVPLLHDLDREPTLILSSQVPMTSLIARPEAQEWLERRAALTGSVDPPSKRETR